MKIAGKTFENYTYVMGIVNVTPDSFYAGSRNTEYTVLKTVERQIAEGAAIIDIGAQSTHPGYTEVPADEELARLEKPITLIKKNFDIPLSVDTYFAKVAKASLEWGADMINDVWGLTHDADMAQTIAKFSAAVCVMHNAPAVLQGDIWQPILEFLRKSVAVALQAGIDKNAICLDGGIGFAKTKEQNWELLNGYDKLAELGYPLLLGTSRKSMFGGKVEDRLEATVASTVLAAQKKVLFVRVHDVKENVEAVKRVYGV